MIKALFKQLMNRKKSNGWILLELLLVFCVLWYLVDYFFVISYNYTLPSYINTDHAWQVNITQYAADHPEYQEEENEPEQIEANYNRILNHIRSYPGVTDLAVSFKQSTPGSDSYTGSTFGILNDTTKTCSIRYITIDPASDYFSVFGFSEENGKKNVSVQDYAWEKPNAVVINSLTASQLFPTGNAVGQTIVETYRTDRMYEIVGVVDESKRFTSERPEALCFVQNRLEASTIPRAEISMRITPSISEKIFIPAFIQDMENNLRIGNFYFLSVGSYNNKVEQLNELSGNNTANRTRFYLMIFFLINVILCVIGTFWYRVNVRREEIGLRMALGSSRENIKSLLISEGILLLSIVTLPALLLEWQFVHAGLIETYGKGYAQAVFLPDRIFLRFLITNGITWLLMAMVIVTSIWLPARRASLLAPAEALHYE